MGEDTGLEKGWDKGKETCSPLPLTRPTRPHQRILILTTSLQQDKRAGGRGPGFIL